MKPNAKAAARRAARWEKMDARPTRRVLRGFQNEAPLIVELSSRFITIRPLGTRRAGKSEVSITASALFDRLLAQRTTAKKGRRA